MEQSPTPSLEHQIGQMLIVGFRGLQCDDSSLIVQQIKNLNLGGVVLFDVDVPSGSTTRNIESPPQVRELTSALQAAASTPLLIAVDQEGGKVARLTSEHGFPPTVSHHTLGQRDCLSFTRTTAAAMAQTLADVGINLNFAPCVDVNLNPANPVIGSKERSFSHDPQLVTRHAVEFIAGHHDRGVLCVLKHFPGHGSSRHDSHLGLVNVTSSWLPDELTPFRALIQRGVVDAVMSAHIFHAAWDDHLPATLAPAVIDGMLRRDLGFQGVVITDDLQMGAISQVFGLQVTVEKAIAAGNDLLLFANNSIYDEHISEKVIEILLRLVQQNKIDPERIHASFERIQSLKKRLTVERNEPC
jgi:beta-N-acetylhexosaminidase